VCQFSVKLHLLLAKRKHGIFSQIDEVLNILFIYLLNDNLPTGSLQGAILSYHVEFQHTTTSFELFIVCPEPPTVPNATPKKTLPSLGAAGNVPGTTFSYTCLDGHEMIGAATLTCLSSKSWDNPQPSCSLIGNLFLYVWFYFDKTALAKSALMPLSRFAALFSLSNDRFLI